MRHALSRDRQGFWSTAGWEQLRSGGVGAIRGFTAAQGERRPSPPAFRGPRHSNASEAPAQPSRRLPAPGAGRLLPSPIRHPLLGVLRAAENGSNSRARCPRPRQPHPALPPRSGVHKPSRRARNGHPCSTYDKEVRAGVQRLLGGLRARGGGGGSAPDFPPNQPLCPVHKAQEVHSPPPWGAGRSVMPPPDAGAT